VRLAGILKGAMDSSCHVPMLCTLCLPAGSRPPGREPGIARGA
jgi:hypothetical protein